MELSELKGLGPSRLERLRAMGIVSLRDLLYFLPVRYEDRASVYPVREIGEGSFAVKGIVSEKPRIAYFHGLSRVTAVLRDSTGDTLPLCWFNEPWMMQQLPVGREVLLFGHVSMKNGRRALQNPVVVTEPGWTPVYRPVKGIPAKSLRGIIRAALSSTELSCPETLPLSFREKHGLTDLHTALRQAHFPDSLELLKAARRRLSFENMLMYLTGVAMQKNQSQPGWPMDLSPEETELFWEKIPFRPTFAQRRVLLEIEEDLTRDRAMSRLVQGDVGCGKTALAFGAVYLAWRCGFQSAMMAPTEILARQHYQNAVSLLEPFGIRCRLLMGSTRAKERRETLQALADGTCDAVFGTHALISAGVKYHRLGLAVTDEQHRFGVLQRSRLQEKGVGEERKAPHVLVMSATPIPRSLALILYGELDLSVVDEMPPGRVPVKTRLVPEEKRRDMYRFMREQIVQGRQAYVVCPLVEDSETLDEVRSAKALYAELTGDVLKDLRVGLTWGAQKSDEKAEVLRRFSEGELDVLVATTVIEVGVNVPNAAVMVIENAERYGLSQLHQLRGRVGRGCGESWCFLLSSAGRKLKVLCETNDGFEVAQKDLELRGPGDLMGTRQSGEALQGFLLDGDTRLLDEAARSVKELMNDPALKEERAAVEQAARRFFREKEIHVALN